MDFGIVQSLRGLQGPKRVTEYDADGNKVRHVAPEALERMFPVLKRAPDAKFRNAGLGIAYTTEVLFTVFASLVLVELFVRDPRALLAMHTARFIAFVTTAILAAYSIYRGVSVPEVRIQFYFLELLIVLAINIAALVVVSRRLAEKRATGQPTSIGDVVTILIPAAFVLFNMYLLGQQVYRFWLEKRTTPINTLFTLLMSVFLAGMSAMAMKRNYESWSNLFS